jgi:hypothetical protein
MEDIMKKILCLTLVILSFACSAFAAATQSASSGSAQTVKGGATAALALASPTPLVKFSTGVFGLVNYSFDATLLTSAGYVIATRHSNGSKNFATANVITNIYWKQAGTPTAKTDAALITVFKSDVGASDETGATAMFTGNGWTSY